MENCLFCRIAKKELPAEVIYEDQQGLCFLDIKPHAQGHAVLIPKTHGETIFDFSEKESLVLMKSIRKIMRLIQDRLNPDGFNIGWNHNTAGGQVIPHLHIHILPRYNGDGGGSMHSIVSNPGKKSVTEIGELFK